MTQLPFHPLAELFPLFSDAELEDLAADIKENGQRDPIIMTPDMDSILDGRNRYRACLKIGVQPKFDTYAGEEAGMLAFVVSRNLRRRHLTESQRAMVAAKLAALPLGANQHASIEAPSQAQAAEMLNVSRSSVQRARQVVERAAPETIAAVERGEVSVSAAAKLAGEAFAQGEATIQIRLTAKQTERMICSSNTNPIKRAANLTKGLNQIFNDLLDFGGNAIGCLETHKEPTNERHALLDALRAIQQVAEAFGSLDGARQLPSQRRAGLDIKEAPAEIEAPSNIVPFPGSPPVSAEPVAQDEAVPAKKRKKLSKKQLQTRRDYMRGYQRKRRATEKAAAAPPVQMAA